MFSLLPVLIGMVTHASQVYAFISGKWIRTYRDRTPFYDYIFTVFSVVPNKDERLVYNDTFRGQIFLLTLESGKFPNTLQI